MVHIRCSRVHCECWEVEASREGEPFSSLPPAAWDPTAVAASRPGLGGFPRRPFLPPEGKDAGTLRAWVTQSILTGLKGDPGAVHIPLTLPSCPAEVCVLENKRNKRKRQ